MLASVCDIHDFQVRLQWCVNPQYDKANHAHVITLDGEADRTVKSGDKVVLTARVEDNDVIDLEPFEII